MAPRHTQRTRPEADAARARFSQKNAPPKGGAVINKECPAKGRGSHKHWEVSPKGSSHVYTKFIPPGQARTAARVSHARTAALTVSIQISAIPAKLLFDSEIRDGNLLV